MLIKKGMTCASQVNDISTGIPLQQNGQAVS